MNVVDSFCVNGWKIVIAPGMLLRYFISMASILLLILMNLKSKKRIKGSFML